MPEPPSSSPLPSDETIRLNIKILSCRDLLCGDMTSSDPYVKIMMGGKQLHKTAYIAKNLNPKYEAAHDNEFTTAIDPVDLKIAGGLRIEVKDFDLIGDNDIIGLAKLSPERLLQMANFGKPTRVRLEPPPDRAETYAGIIVLTIKREHLSVYNFSRSSNFKIEIPMPPLDFTDPQPTKSGPPPYNKELLIEILFCRGLIPADSDGTSDPFVQIVMGNKILHKTVYVARTLNPAFSIDHKNAYMLTCSSHELWANNGIKLQIMDWDMLSACDDLGYVHLSPKMLYEADGSLTELKLVPPKGATTTSAGFINFRIREKSLRDVSERAAAEAEAVAKDDEQNCDSNSVGSVFKKKKQKMYKEDRDSDSDTDSSDMFLESDDDDEFDMSNSYKHDASPKATRGKEAGKTGSETPKTKKLKRKMKGASKKQLAKQKGKFVKKIDELTRKLRIARMEKDEVKEKMLQNAERIKVLERENDLLKEENKKIRMKFKKNKYSVKTNLAYKGNRPSTKILPLLKKHKEMKNRMSIFVAPAPAPAIKAGEALGSNKDRKKMKTKQKKGKKKKGKKKRPKGAPNREASSQDSTDSDTSSSEDELSSSRRLLKRVGVSDSMIEHQSLYSFVRERDEEEENKSTDDDSDELPDFDRKNKDMEFAALSFFGVERIEEGEEEEPDSTEEEEEAPNKIEEDVPDNAQKHKDKEVDPTDFVTLAKQIANESATEGNNFRPPTRSSVSRRNIFNQQGSSYFSTRPAEKSTTTQKATTSKKPNSSTRALMLPGALQPSNPLAASRIAHLEQEVTDLKEELEAERANPGAYDKAIMETQLKLAQESIAKLTEKNERLQTLNRIQTKTMLGIAQEQIWGQ